MNARPLRIEAALGGFKESKIALAGEANEMLRYWQLMTASVPRLILVSPPLTADWLLYQTELIQA